MNKIESEIWDYLDGNLNEHEELLIKQLIENNAQYRLLFEKLEGLNTSLQQLELEEQSMGFHRNVMNQIALEHVPGSFKSLIDKRIIYTITAFFIITIGGLLLYLFTTISWSSMSDAPGLVIVPPIDYSALSNSNFIKAFLSVDIILVMLLIDGLLRRVVNVKKLKNI